MNKTSLFLLPIILLSCSSPSETNPVLNSSPNQTNSLSSPVQNVKPSNNIKNSDSNNNFLLSKGITAPYTFTGKINGRGDGLIILKNYAIKLINFKPVQEKNVLDNELSSYYLNIDDDGDGILLLAPDPTTTLPRDNYSKNYDYKTVSDFNISDTIITTSVIPINNLNESKIKKYNDITKSVKASDSLRLDENGNGILIKYDLVSDFFKLSLVKNYTFENKEYLLTPEKNIFNMASSKLKTDIDKEGNGYISWTYDYVKNGSVISSEIIIKKLENYIAVGNEISLGTDYLNAELTLNKSGTGFITWSQEYNPPFSRFRKINNYIPEPKAYDLNLNNSGRYQGINIDSQNIIKNNSGDGLLIWQESNSNENNDYPYGSYLYARLFKNYDILTQNLKEYTPQPKPTPELYKYPYSSITKDQKVIETSLINGIVYDINKDIVKDVEINMTFLDDNTINMSPQNTYEAKFNSEVPIGDIEISASKRGYKTRTRKIKVIANPYGLTEINKFDFGGNIPENEKFFLENE